MSKRHYVAAILLGAFAVAGVAGTIYAGDCPPRYFEIDHWELELVEVTVDGEAVENKEDYDDAVIELEGNPPPQGGVYATVTSVDSGETDRFYFEPTFNMPSDLRSYSSAGDE